MSKNDGRHIDESTEKSNMDSSGLGSHAQDSSNLLVPPNIESYLLNGIVNYIVLNQETHEKLVSLYPEGHIFTATRIQSKKINFKIRSQIGFNHNVPSTILITPFTVVILIKLEDMIKYTGTKFGKASAAQSDQNDMEGDEKVEAKFIPAGLQP